MDTMVGALDVVFEPAPRRVRTWRNTQLHPAGHYGLPRNAWPWCLVNRLAPLRKEANWRFHNTKRGPIRLKSAVLAGLVWVARIP